MKEAKPVKMLRADEAKSLETSLARLLQPIGRAGRSSIDACGVKEPGLQLSMIEGFLTTCVAMACRGAVKLVAVGEVPVEPGLGEQLQGVVGRSIDSALDRIFAEGEDAPDA